MIKLCNTIDRAIPGNREKQNAMRRKTHTRLPSPVIHETLPAKRTHWAMYTIPELLYSHQGGMSREKGGKITIFSQPEEEGENILDSLFTNGKKNAIITRCQRTRAGGSMDRASDSGSEGWGFESLPAYQKNRYSFEYLFFCLFPKGRDSNHKMPVSGGHRLAAGWTAAAPKRNESLPA